MLLFLLSLLTIGFAMKPAPFTEVYHQDESTGLILHSNPSTKKTSVQNPKGETLWTMDEFIGRKAVFLSPDGTTLIVFGNEFFGSILASNESYKILVVYKNGTRIKEYNFQEFFGFNIAEAKKRYDVPVMGGGWLGFMRYVKIGTIDWKQRNIPLSFIDDTFRNVSF